MPDERRATEQDLFSRAALVWRIERRTKIGLSHREPKPVLEGSTERESKRKLERTVVITIRDAPDDSRRWSRHLQMCVAQVGRRREQKKETLLGPAEAVAPQNNAPANTHGRGGGLTDWRLSGRFIIRPVRRIKDCGGTTASRRPDSGGDSTSSASVPRIPQEPRRTRLRLTHLGVGHRHLA